MASKEVKITWSSNSSVHQRLIGGFLDDTCMLLVAQMVQHIHACIYHSDWVGNIFAGNGSTSVASARLKYGVLKKENFKG